MYIHRLATSPSRLSIPAFDLANPDSAAVQGVIVIDLRHILLSSTALRYLPSSTIGPSSSPVLVPMIVLVKFCKPHRYPLVDVSGGAWHVIKHPLHLGPSFLIE
ncbi:hypothetical protein QCA50_009752 [Cerrena zonata]|uniref:Uncharacterized protein n=1 Tax=Cerrena zonata TaxID=2478898 RepID=A0AAW0GDS9_9APHY